jgi:hypothetical protein
VQSHNLRVTDRDRWRVKLEDRLLELIALGEEQDLDALHECLCTTWDYEYLPPSHADVHEALEQLERNGDLCSSYRCSWRPLKYGRPIFQSISGERQDQYYRLTLRGVVHRYVLGRSRSIR